MFAEEAGAGRERRIVLMLDNAGWHGEAGLAVPDGVRLVFQPAYTPEVQPAETLWTLVDEPVVNQHIPTARRQLAGVCVTFRARFSSLAASA